MLQDNSLGSNEWRNQKVSAAQRRRQSINSRRAGVVSGTPFQTQVQCQRRTANKVVVVVVVVEEEEEEERVDVERDGWRRESRAAGTTASLQEG